MRIVPLLVVLTLIPLAAGCTFMQGAGGQMGVMNQKDKFYYGMQGVKDGTETYTWENTKRDATVNMGVQGAGSVTITIKDPDGKTMLSREFSGAGQSGSSAIASSGTPGQWTITFAFKSFSGQGGITIQAR